MYATYRLHALFAGSGPSASPLMDQVIVTVAPVWVGVCSRACFVRVRAVVVGEMHVVEKEYLEFCSVDKLKLKRVQKQVSGDAVADADADQKEDS